jgi:hypothetical protein
MPNPSEIERMTIADLDAIEKWSKVRVMGLPFQYIRALIAETKRLLADNARLREALRRCGETTYGDHGRCDFCRDANLIAALALRESEARP